MTIHKPSVDKFILLFQSGGEDFPELLQSLVDELVILNKVLRVQMCTVIGGHDEMN